MSYANVNKEPIKITDMNAICQFRKCTLTDKELAAEIDRITDEMYFKTHEVPTRQIPARPDKDYDLLIGELLIRFKELSKKKQVQ